MNRSFPDGLLCSNKSPSRRILPPRSTANNDFPARMPIRPYSEKTGAAEAGVSPPQRRHKRINRRTAAHGHDSRRQWLDRFRACRCPCWRWGGVRANRLSGCWSCLGLPKDAGGNGFLGVARFCRSRCGVVSIAWTARRWHQ